VSLQHKLQVPQLLSVIVRYPRPTLRNLPQFFARYEIGNGRKPTSLPPQPGFSIVAPLWLRELQRARCRSRSLDASAPQRMTATAQADGAWC